MDTKQLFAIACGGSVGALARFWVANGIYGTFGRGFPHGTLVVNVSGCLAMGVLTELMVQRFALAVEYRAAVLVGFLGAYTTFSTFAIETLYLMEEGSWTKALLNVVLSVGLCLFAVWLGLLAGRGLFLEGSTGWIGSAFPLGVLIGGAVVAFSLGLGAAWLWDRQGWPTQSRNAFIIVSLGVTTTLAALGLLLKWDGPANGHQTSALLYAFQALVGAAAAWGGLIVGKQL